MRQPFKPCNNQFMISHLILLFFIITHLVDTKKENAAPSTHLSFRFQSPDAILKMQKIKIVQSANASYFEVNSFTSGYAGFQQTADKSFGNANIFIASLWDPNTSKGIHSMVDY